MAAQPQTAPDETFPRETFPREIAGIPIGEGFQHAPFAIMRISRFNPRTVIAEAEIVALAENIALRGIMQNLTARPERDESGAWVLGILAGGRRLRAVARLVADGRRPATFPVPVRVVNFTDRDALGWAIEENDQREQLTPLEQGKAYAELIALGDSDQVIAAKAGRTVKFVRQRLVFHTRLSDRVKEVFAQGLIDIAQAQAFTIGDAAEQDALLPRVLSHGSHYAPAQIRAAFVGHKIPLSRAVFDVERMVAAGRLRGVRRDLFGEEDYAEDREEFARLQRDAVEARRDQLRGEGWEFVTIADGGPFPPGPWQHGIAADAGGGVVIHVADNLAVRVITGLKPVKPIVRNTSELRGPSSREGRGGAPSPSDQRERAAPVPLLSAAQLAWSRQVKTERLQAAAADTADTATIVAIAVLMLLGCLELGVPRRPLKSPALKARLADIEKLAPSLALDLVEERPELVFDALRALPDFVLLSLLRVLVADRLCAWPEETAGAPGDSPLAIAFAEQLLPVDDDLGLTAATKPFAIPPGYLERLSLDQLRRVARDCGIAGELAPGADRDAAIETIGLSLNRSPSWAPPELRFGDAAELAALLQPAEEETP